MFGHLSDRELLLRIHERIQKMATIDDLNAAVSAITTAVNDASSGIKDIAAKLAAASSLNPADVEIAANKLTSLASSLESAVKAAGEPVTSAAPSPEPAPAPSPEPAPAE